MAALALFARLCVFSLWMLASFLCHKMAKMAMELYISDMTSHSTFVMPLTVTLFQMLMCYSVVDMTHIQQPMFYVIMLSHLLATLATNTSMALTFASSTMAIKMLEPTTSAVLQTFLMKTPLKVEAIVGMVMTVVGAVLYVANPAHNGDLTRAALLAVISNLTFGVRNIAIKLSQGASLPVTKFRSVWNIIGLFSFVAVVSYLILFSPAEPAVVSPNLTHFVLLSMASGVFHVTYSYVSTSVVLSYMSVVGHAIANIFKRVLVVLLLHVSGRRSASPWNWMGLALCTLGLLVYNGRRLKSPKPPLSLPTPNRPACQEARKETGSGDAGREKVQLLGRFVAALTLFFILGLGPHRLQLRSLTASSQTRGQEQVVHLQPSSFSHKLFNTSGKESVEADLVSKVFKTNPQHKTKSPTNYVQNLRFGYVNFTDGKPLITDPLPFQPERKSAADIWEFLSREHLLDTPFDTDGLSPYLRTTQGLIEETKRIHLNLFRDLFKGRKYAFLFLLATIENKGDSALSVAELVMLEDMGIEVVFYINEYPCEKRRYDYALKLAGQYHQEETVILIHGGGNIMGYKEKQVCRKTVFELFKHYYIVFFSQSIYMNGNKADFEYSRHLYCCNPKLTMLLRDRLSLNIAQRIFNNGTRLLLAPDIAFQLGHVDRFAPPYYDVMWQKRVDAEARIGGERPADELPPDVTVRVFDWRQLLSIRDESSLKMAVNVMENGLAILQQGRVVVTDRLHGHILSTLLDIPHVLLDTPLQKLSAYHNTWTRGLANCRITDNVKDAARLAMELLEEYKGSLPKRLAAADIDENKFKNADG